MLLTRFTGRLSNEMVIIHRQEELMHYGVPGTHWGIRRYQNKDGSYKPGAEGRYYTPVKTGKISGSRYNSIPRSSGGQSIIKSNASKKNTMGYERAEKNSPKISSGGGGASKKDTTTKTDSKNPEMNAKTRDGRDYHIYDVSEKLAVTKDAKKKSGGSGRGSGKKSEKGSGGGRGESSGKESQKNFEKIEETEFKISNLYDKISDLFGSKSLTQADWNETKLSDKDVAEIDELIKKYRQYKSLNSSETKKTKKIDEFIEQYEKWKKLRDKRDNITDPKNDDIQKWDDYKHLELAEEKKTNKQKRKSISHSDDYLTHCGILGMHWRIRRYQNPDGTYTEAGKKC